MHNGGEFMPGLVLPLAYHGVLGKRLTQIDMTDSLADFRIVQARAEGMVEALELLKALEADQIERLYLVVSRPPRRACRNWGAPSDRPGDGCEYPAGAGQYLPGAHAVAGRRERRPQSMDVEHSGRRPYGEADSGALQA